MFEILFSGHAERRELSVRKKAERQNSLNFSSAPWRIWLMSSCATLAAIFGTRRVLGLREGSDLV